MYDQTKKKDPSILLQTCALTFEQEFIEDEEQEKPPSHIGSTTRPHIDPTSSAVGHGTFSPGSKASLPHVPPSIPGDDLLNHGEMSSPQTLTVQITSQIVLKNCSSSTSKCTPKCRTVLAASLMLVAGIQKRVKENKAVSNVCSLPPHCRHCQPDDSWTVSMSADDHLSSAASTEPTVPATTAPSSTDETPVYRRK